MNGRTATLSQRAAHASLRGRGIILRACTRRRTDEHDRNHRRYEARGERRHTVRGPATRRSNRRKTREERRQGAEGSRNVDATSRSTRLLSVCSSRACRSAPPRARVCRRAAVKGRHLRSAAHLPDAVHAHRACSSKNFAATLSQTARLKVNSGSDVQTKRRSCAPTALLAARAPALTSTRFARSCRSPIATTVSCMKAPAEVNRRVLVRYRQAGRAVVRHRDPQPRAKSAKEGSPIEADWGVVGASTRQSRKRFRWRRSSMMMRNALGVEEGGSGVPLDCEAHRRSVAFWESHANWRP